MTTTAERPLIDARLKARPSGIRDALRTPQKLGLNLRRVEYLAEPFRQELNTNLGPHFGTPFGTISP